MLEVAIESFRCKNDSNSNYVVNRPIKLGDYVKNTCNLFYKK